MTALPLSEIIAIYKHLPATGVQSFMNTAPLRDLRNPETPPPTATDDRGRSSQRFVIEVVARGDARDVRIAAAGRDIYAVTAPLVVEACARILAHPPSKGGAYAPGELFEPMKFLGALREDIRIV